MRAAIDIGSNSVLLLIKQGDRVVADLAEIVGLGRGLQDGGPFRGDRMVATLAVLRRYASVAVDHGVAPTLVQAVATSASRRATNAMAFYGQVKAETGIPVRIIDGEEEARLTWDGARAGLDLPPGTHAVVDVGGGSTEVVLGSPEAWHHSFEVGTVRQTEAHFGSPDPQFSRGARHALELQLAQVLGALPPSPRPRALIAVAGTATTLAAMDLGLSTWDAHAVHGHVHSLASLEAWMDRLAAASPEERRTLAAIAPGRADHLLAGAAILHRVASGLGVDRLVVSVGGIRHGLLG
jgi:exopolyphosphatase/guanosine-5'-triphosphate,3'-diphosphate pyrophosphatase